MISPGIVNTLHRLVPPPWRIQDASTNDLSGPVLLAMQAPQQRGLLLATAPGPDARWTPAPQWPRALGGEPVVPVHLHRGQGVELRVGRAIDPALLSSLGATEDRLGYVQLRTELLSNSEPARRGATVAPDAIAAPEPVESVAGEVAGLPAHCCLVESGDFSVYLAEASAIPHTLLEIGRLREAAFRDAGEGTGRARDLDSFDAHYLHLFVWNSARREVAGAYRLRFTDGNSEALYTTTLFQIAPEFFRSLGPAIELGRSFVRLEYQKSFAPLLLLWKGIGRIVAGRPGYTTLFGPVSISNSYQSISRELMMAFLERHALLADLAQWVRPKCSPRRRAGLSAAFCRDVDTLSGVVADLEPNRLGIPVLLRQYLRLGGKLLGFNVDRDFAEALDGLIVVDLLKTDPRLLDRFLGKAETAAVRNHRKGHYGNLEDKHDR